MITIPPHEIAAFLGNHLDQVLQRTGSNFLNSVAADREFKAGCAIMDVLNAVEAAQESLRQLLEKNAQRGRRSELQSLEVRIMSLYLLHCLYNYLPIQENPFLCLFVDIYNLAVQDDRLKSERFVTSIILNGDGAELAPSTPSELIAIAQEADSKPVNLRWLDEFLPEVPIEDQVEIGIGWDKAQERMRLRDRKRGWATFSFSSLMDDSRSTVSSPLPDAQQHQNGSPQETTNGHPSKEVLVSEAEDEEELEEWEIEAAKRFQDSDQDEPAPAPAPTPAPAPVASKKAAAKASTDTSPAVSRQRLNSLMEQATIQPLSFDQEQYMLSQFSSDPAAKIHIPLPPHQALLGIVDNNPTIAFNLLLHLIQLSGGITTPAAALSPAPPMTPNGSTGGNTYWLQDYPSTLTSTSTTTTSTTTITTTNGAKIQDSNGSGATTTTTTSMTDSSTLDQNDRSVVTAYLETLTRAKRLTLHSLEVVNRLSSATVLSPGFLHAYIENAIRCCEKVEDKMGQARVVRMLCVFLQSMLRSGGITLADYYYALVSFCVQFSRVKEVAVLFQSLVEYKRQRDDIFMANNQNEGGSGTGTGGNGNGSNGRRQQQQSPPLQGSSSPSQQQPQQQPPQERSIQLQDPPKRQQLSTSINNGGGSGGGGSHEPSKSWLASTGSISHSTKSSTLFTKSSSLSGGSSSGGGGGGGFASHGALSHFIQPSSSSSGGSSGLTTATTSNGGSLNGKNVLKTLYSGAINHSVPASPLTSTHGSGFGDRDYDLEAALKASMKDVGGGGGGSSGSGGSGSMTTNSWTSVRNSGGNTGGRRSNGESSPSVPGTPTNGGGKMNFDAFAFGSPSRVRGSRRGG